MKHNQFKHTYDSIKKGGYEMNNGILNEKMYIYGSTIERYKYPCFWEYNKIKMILYQSQKAGQVHLGIKYGIHVIGYRRLSKIWNIYV